MNRFGLAFAALLLAACASADRASQHDTHVPATVPAQEEITLQPDAFDAPAASSVAEAKRAKGKQPAGANQQVTFACPMHPEVTSATVGKCPKCGMALVGKESKP